MSGVDRADQTLSYHSALRKTNRWYKKVGIHIIEMILSNAYYMYTSATTYRRVKNMKCFREIVIESLIGAPKQCIIPATEKKKTPTRVCRYCSTKDKRKESRYQSLKCEKEPALCIDPCFRLYHVKLGIAPSDTDESTNESDFD